MNLCGDILQPTPSLPALQFGTIKPIITWDCVIMVIFVIIYDDAIQYIILKMIITRVLMATHLKVGTSKTNNRITTRLPKNCKRNIKLLNLSCQLILSIYLVNLSCQNLD